MLRSPSIVPVDKLRAEELLPSFCRSLDLRFAALQLRMTASSFQCRQKEKFKNVCQMISSPMQ
jgi:hypothetical protein